jgi:hypothetical protein
VCVRWKWVGTGLACFVQTMRLVGEWEERGVGVDIGCSYGAINVLETGDVGLGGLPVRIGRNGAQEQATGARTSPKHYESRPSEGGRERREREVNVEKVPERLSVIGPRQNQRQPDLLGVILWPHRQQSADGRARTRQRKWAELLSPIPEL